MTLSNPLPLLGQLVAAALLLGSCAVLKETTSIPTSPAPVPAGAGADVSALLGMSFEEAASIAPQHLEAPNLPKVAADKIEVLSKTSDGKPKKVRAKGRVFLLLDQQEQSHALCDEALISAGDLILRGKPVLQRGSSTVEGLSDVTVFYLFGPQLKVIGRHRLTNISRLAGESPWKSDGGTASLLPPLDSADVPQAVRDEMRKAAEAEAQLQRSRIGLPAAFPDAVDGTHAPGTAVPVPGSKPKEQ